MHSKYYNKTNINTFDMLYGVFFLKTWRQRAFVHGAIVALANAVFQFKISKINAHMSNDFEAKEMRIISIFMGSMICQINIRLTWGLRKNSVIRLARKTKNAITQL